MHLLKLLLPATLIITFSAISFAEDKHKDHDHSKHKKHSSHKDHDDHGDHDGHDHKKDKDMKKHSKHDGHDHGDDHQHGDDHDDHSSHAHGHGGGQAVGKNKAITEVDEKKGFKLSKEAIKTLKLKLQTVDRESFKISKKTLVAFKKNKGVYRFRAGFFKLLPASISKELSDGYMVTAKGVDFGDQIVVDGVALLRVADVYSTDKSEYGHSH